MTSTTLAPQNTVMNERGIPCPRCSAGTGSTDTRPATFLGHRTRRRRRACVACGNRFTSYEFTRDQIESLMADAVSQHRTALSRMAREVFGVEVP